MAKNMCLPPTDKTVLLMLTLPKWNLFSAFDDDIFHQLEILLFQYHALSVCLSVCRATIPHDYPIKICVLRKCVAYTYLMMDKSTTIIIIIEWYFASIQEVGWSCVCAWQIVLKFGVHLPRVGFIRLVVWIHLCVLYMLHMWLWHLDVHVYRGVHVLQCMIAVVYSWTCRLSFVQWSGSLVCIDKYLGTLF